MHPLYGPRGKVERANRQIVGLQQEFKRFCRDTLYEIGVAEYNSKAGNYSLRVKSGPQEFPIDWSVLIGEIAYNLRSALDGLTWRLALLGPNPPFSHTSFPICLDKRLDKKLGDRTYPAFDACKEKGRGCIQSVPSHLWTRFESFQPYKRGNGGRHSPLVLLNELNNTDKHRMVTAITAVPRSMELTGMWGGPAKLKGGVPLNLNAKVGYVRPLPPEGIRVLDLVNGQPLTANGKLRTRIQHEVQVNAKITPGIVFGSTCNAVKHLPMIPALQRMANQVSSVIESFAGEF